MSCSQCGSAAAAGAIFCGDCGAPLPDPEGGERVDVRLAEVGDRKISVIRDVVDMTGLGLARAKELVEAAPATLLTGVSRRQGELVKSRLEAAGAGVELVPR